MSTMEDNIEAQANHCLENVEDVKLKKGAPNSLSLLRALFKDFEHVGVDGGIQAYVLPRTDAHQSEYLAQHDCRVEFISGFSGSNGYAIITETEALLWTDGRYFLQAEEQLKPGWTLMKEGTPDAITPSDWIIQNMKPNSAIGFDPQLFGIDDGRKLFSRWRNFNLVPVQISKHNLVDIIWENRPPKLQNKIICLSLNECGEELADKVKRVREKFQQNRCDSILLTLLDDIAWLFNIRGFDIPYNPVVFSIALITCDEIVLFIDKEKISSEVARHLEGVKVLPYEEANDYIAKFHQKSVNDSPNTHRIWIPNTVNYGLASVVDPKYSYICPSPVQSMKSIKNDVELNGMRQSSVRDSAAIVQFLLWMRRELELGHIVDEVRAAKQMNYFRKRLEGFVSLSFPTISAVNKHAALPHYSLDVDAPETEEMKQERRINTDSIYLIDSGAQYRDGTTDVTRTITQFEVPDDHFRKMFTLVLKGHINCATTKFPENISGIRLDSIARLPLWNHGYDFEHGVGHGVGHFLNVHEGPVGIGHRLNYTSGIRKGMVLTIEPGYYEKDHFGIRIENSYEVVAAAPLASQAQNFITFSPLTYVPIQKNLIVRELLTNRHINWINAYHNRCLELVGKYLQEQGLQDEYNFLAEACTPL